jgi:zinc transporter 9
MGVLVGTSLIVIIPEGVDTLYSAGEVSGHRHAPRSTSPRFLTPLLQASRRGPARVVRRIEIENTFSRRDELPDSIHDSISGPITADEEKASFGSPSPKSSVDMDIPDTSQHPVDAPSTQSSRTSHAWIGVSLIFGFILMYLLDTLPTLSAASNSRGPAANIYSLSDLSSASPPPPPQRALSTTLGLCIHAIADGIALGASSSSTSTTSLSLIIFVAIMVHKAPASFGLTAVLLKQGLGKRGARAHLVAFSLAAPIGAVGTWVVVRTLGGGAGDEESLRWWTGVLLLFSGGTFLYVYIIPSLHVNPFRAYLFNAVSS